MVIRFVILGALGVIVVSLWVRWWHGLRVLRQGEDERVRCNLDQWPPVCEGGEPLRSEGSATYYAQYLHRQLLSDWQSEQSSTYRRWQRAYRFGVIMPPLAMIVCVLIFFAAKLNLILCLLVPVLILILSILFQASTVPLEQQRVNEFFRTIRDQRYFRSQDDALAVYRCMRAMVWMEAMPKILKMLAR